MSTKLKIISVLILALLALALAAGIAVIATHVALGTFLFTAAFMLGPFVGFALLLGGILIAQGTLSKSLFSLAGFFLLSAMACLFALPWSAAAPSLPLFVVGAGLGIVAVVTQYPMRRRH